jgi:hypothetical protein
MTDAWITENKGAVPWARGSGSFAGGTVPFQLVKQSNVSGYNNNPRWVPTPAAPDKHAPCGHWHEDGGQVFIHNPSGHFYRCASASNGEFWGLAENNGQLGITFQPIVSRDSGISWERLTVFGRWNAITINSSGMFILASDATTAVDKTWLSRDGGYTWTMLSIPSHTFADISDNGQYMTTSSAAGVYSSRDYGATWTFTALSSDASKIVMIGDGRIQKVGGYYIYTSFDYGVTWVALAAWNPSWSYAQSLTGKYVYFGTTRAAGNFYRSDFYGREKLILPGDFPADGIVAGYPVIATAMGSEAGRATALYQVSNNSWVVTGTTGLWMGVDKVNSYSEGEGTVKPANSVVINTLSSEFDSYRICYEVCCSSIGDMAAAIIAQDGSASNKKILITNDYGVTWVESLSLRKDISFLSMSLSGKYLSVIAPGSLDQVYVSDNYGASWHKANSPIKQWTGKGMSPNGKYGLIMQLTNTTVPQIFYTTIDYGETWVGGQWKDIVFETDNPVWTLPS